MRKVLYLGWAIGVAFGIPLQVFIMTFFKAFQDDLEQEIAENDKTDISEILTVKNHRPIFLSKYK